MNPIGGYFELELPKRRDFPHNDGVLLNSGRNALECVLLALGNVRHVWVPYYTCDVVLEPMNKHKIPYSFYSINQNLEIDQLPSLQSGEYLLYTNYYGIKDKYVKKLASHFNSQLIVDNAQAWFAEPIEGVNTVYSPRKYVGLPDGGVAYCIKHIDEIKFEQDFSNERCSHLLKRIDVGASESYSDFKLNSKRLDGQPIKRMSRLTQRILSSIDFGVVKSVRNRNFEFLHGHLGKTNLFKVPLKSSFTCPMVYPYLTDDRGLRQKLIDNKVFVATYWPNVSDWASEDMLERRLTEMLIPIPCDQRYGIEEMKAIINLV